MPSLSTTVNGADMARSNPLSDAVQFTVGASLFGGGLFLFLNQVMVHSGMPGGYHHRWGWPGWSGSPTLPWGTPGMGLLMVPLGIGVALLLAGKSERLAKLLVWGALAAVLVGVLNSLRFSFRPATLWQLAVNVVMMGSGGGLMFRSLDRYTNDGPYQAPAAEPSGGEQGDLRRELDDLRRRLEELYGQDS